MTISRTVIGWPMASCAHRAGSPALAGKTMAWNTPFMAIHTRNASEIQVSLNSHSVARW